MQMFSQNFFSIFNKIPKEFRCFIGNCVEILASSPLGRMQDLLHFS